MSENNPDLAKSTQNNSALENDDAGEYYDTFNVAAETLVKDVLQDVEQSEEQDEQFFDVTTGLENCILDDKSESTDQNDSKEYELNREEDPAKSVVNDSSLTDDEIEVICRYSSPNVANDYKKENEESESEPEKDEKCTLESTKNVTDISPSRDAPEAKYLNDEINLQYPPPIMYLPPECYMSPPPDIHPRSSVPNPNYYSPHMYSIPPPEVYPSHLLEPQVMQTQDLNQAQSCEQIENGGYMAYSNGEPQSTIYPNYPPPLPSSPFSAPYNDQYLGDMNDFSYPGEPSFVYPSIYVSASGLITVLLRNDTSVEMTIDRTVRIVSHISKMAVASSSRGHTSILYHPHVKLYQDGNVTNAQINTVRAKMATEDIWFANEVGSFKFDSNLIEPASPNFRDMSKDDSVNLLFSADTYGDKLVPQCLEVASMAEYENLPKGGVLVRINGVKITQSGRGDVVVVTGPKYLKMSPSLGLIRINTQYIEVTVEKDASTRIRRGPHLMTAQEGQVILSNGRIEAGFDDHGRLKVLSLPGRSPLEIGVRRSRRQNGPPRRRPTAVGSVY